MSNTNQDYILGTEKAELDRLGLQHQVWASEASKGWKIGGFTKGQRILDLGCGPGFCTTELSYIVGDTGQVIATDKSEIYIRYLENLLTTQNITNVELIQAEFDDLDITPGSLDGIYHRWALAWIDNPKEVILKMKDMLVAGGVVVSQEYYDWSLFQTYPQFPELSKCIGHALQSFHDSPGDINIGRKLPQMYSELGMEVVSVRPMSKFGYENNLVWQWPYSFLKIYFPKLIDMGYFSTSTCRIALQQLESLVHIKGATICCPLMVEVVAKKTA